MHLSCIYDTIFKSIMQAVRKVSLASVVLPVMYEMEYTLTLKIKPFSKK